MEKKWMFLLGVIVACCVCTNAQPAGFNYVIQPNFGDQLGTSYPDATNQWIFNGYWDNVQTIGVQTNWYGPNFPISIGASSRPYHIMLDDANNRQGAVAGNVSDLEYRLVRCNFKYFIYNEINPNESASGGTLYVVLAKTELNVAQFDATDPAAFEAGGYGQLLLTIDLGFQPPSRDISMTWDSLSSQPVAQTGPHRAFVRNASSNGLPGDPFQYVGLIWDSEFNDNRICIDDFRLIDACPNCVMREPLTNNGCMDSTWTTPITNNYYLYTVAIRDSATNMLMYESQNQPAPFTWDGIGNAGQSNGLPVPYNTPLLVRMDYYSCMASTDNYRTENYRLVRSAGCVDSAFGGGRVSPDQQGLSLFPNPVQAGGKLNLRFPPPVAAGTLLTWVDSKGTLILQRSLTDIERRQGELLLKTAELADGIYFISINDHSIRYSNKVIINKFIP